MFNYHVFYNEFDFVQVNAMNDESAIRIAAHVLAVEQIGFVRTQLRAVPNQPQFKPRLGTLRQVQHNDSAD